MKLYEQITAENWCKRSEFRMVPGAATFRLRPQWCLLGHAHHWLRPSELEATLIALDEAARVLFPERTGWCGMRAFIAVNDHPDTTVADIIRVAKVADV